MEIRRDKEIHLTHTANRILGILTSNYILRLKQNQLQPNGSFFLKNSELIKATGRCKNTIIKTKKLLQAAGLINYQTHQGSGRATHYWLLIEKIVKPPPKNSENPPFERFQGTTK